MGSKGFRRKSRKLLTRKPRERGMQPLGRMLYKYRVGDKAAIKIDPSLSDGMPPIRYHGKIGVVTEQRGRAYIVDLQEGGKLRRLIARPEHLVPYSDSSGG